MDKFVTIQTFTHPLDAAIIRSKLESEGIECFIQNEYQISVDPLRSVAIGGAQLQVKESDFTLATEIVNNWQASNLKETEEEREDGKVICPVCHSDQADRGQYRILIFLISLLLLGIPFFYVGIPFLYMGRRNICYKCGYEFPTATDAQKKTV